MIFGLLGTLLQIYGFVILARLLLSWVPDLLDPYHPAVQFLHQITDPVTHQRHEIIGQRRHHRSISRCGDLLGFVDKVVDLVLDGLDLEKADRAGRHPGRLPMPQLHDFRKALDRLNVAVRFLGSTYPAHAVLAYRKRSDAVRDIIGATNDAEVTKALALDLAADGSPAVSACAAALATWAEQRQADALTGLKQAARKFRTEPAFWGV